VRYRERTARKWTREHCRLTGGGVFFGTTRRYVDFDGGKTAQ
jgi:hypothetical protein